MFGVKVDTIIHSQVIGHCQLSQYTTIIDLARALLIQRCMQLLFSEYGKDT